MGDVMSFAEAAWQAAFEEAWGPDWTGTTPEDISVGASPDGREVGIRVVLKDGQVVRFSLPLVDAGGQPLQALAVALRAAASTCEYRLTGAREIVPAPGQTVPAVPLKRAWKSALHKALWRG